ESRRTENNEIVSVDLAFALEPAFGGREFDRPLEVGAYPGGRMFVAQQPGTVLLLDPDGFEPAPLIDLSERVEIEFGEGLLSLALDPGFEQNGYLWAYYYADEPARSILARYEVRDDVADPDTELVVLNLPQPGSNQNGGSIRFGPRDGMLYLTLGDGSASFDPFENGQDPSTLLGAILRIDVRNARPEESYVVPDDNPFVGRDGFAPEVWAWGVRNPWRAAFDPETGKLWGGDVMSGSGEEVNVFERGKNYGWNDQEGFDCLLRTPCDGFADPVAAFNHETERCAVTGGVVYRGEAIPALRGLYLFADFCTGDLMALDADDPDEIMLIGRVEGGFVTSFGLDAAGEVYVTSFETGVWRLVAQ
ncbi:MAG TPA: PQQ-dependent sugar dehydrogenase, partial [Dehalococcoidia bacterium]|nr:PQQ-dependent sugar dehydrogenase [Dehalococcoidia bacterium]